LSLDPSDSVHKSISNKLAVTTPTAPEDYRKLKPQAEGFGIPNS
jgi:hypothetical protein